MSLVASSSDYNLEGDGRTTGQELQHQVGASLLDSSVLDSLFLVDFLDLDPTTESAAEIAVDERTQAFTTSDCTSIGSSPCNFTNVAGSSSNQNNLMPSHHEERIGHKKRRLRICDTSRVNLLHLPDHLCDVLNGGSKSALAALVQLQKTLHTLHTLHTLFFYFILFFSPYHK